VGTVTITPAGVRSHTGGVTPSAIGTYNNAIYTATGEPNATYSITLPASTTISSGANSMTVNNFTSDPTPTGLLNGGGSQTINVGATLNVGASQATGNYSGTYDVTIAYN
ncbi:MAG: YapH protein, partial [Bacteroidetes bacterium]